MKRLMFTMMAVGLLMACGGGSTDTMRRHAIKDQREGEVNIRKTAQKSPRQMFGVRV